MFAPWMEPLGANDKYTPFEFKKGTAKLKVMLEALG